MGYELLFARVLSSQNFKELIIPTLFKQFQHTEKDKSHLTVLMKPDRLDARASGIPQERYLEGVYAESPNKVLANRSK